MGGWPYNEDDQMEIGTSGWVPVGEGYFLNKNNNHVMDDLGREFDENGNLIYDPNKGKESE